MTPEQHIKAWDDTIKRIETGMADTMLSIGFSAQTLIKERIIETGKNAKGGQFPPYSVTPTLTNCSAMLTKSCTRIAGSKAKRRELKWVTIKRGDRAIRLFELPGGYKQFRELHDRQTGFVDFSFTNNMWNNISVISDYSQHERGVAVIGAKDDINKKKLAGNTARKGEILDLSIAEQNKLKEHYNLKVLQIIKENNV